MPLVPGCVSAEPDGLNYAELRATLQAIAVRLDVAGFNLAGGQPAAGRAHPGDLFNRGAHTVIEFLGHICAQPRWAARRSARAGRSQS